MNYPGTVRVHVTGEPRIRVTLVAAVVGLLVLTSGAFVVGMDVGLSLGWIGVALGMAFVAGWIRAGLGPTIGSLWLIGLWWFMFPPLVGYLGGGWEVASRYNHPRMGAWVYGSARLELIGGIEYGVKFGLLFAVILGTIAYVAGAASPWFSKQVKAYR